MSFFTKCEYLHLPCKRIVDDLIERSGPPDEESFTPYNGMNDLIEEQMRGRKFSFLGLDVIKESITELETTKLKGKEEFESDKGDSLSIKSDNYVYLLEEIDEEYIRDFIRSQLIGIKVNKTPAKKVIEEDNKIQSLMRDSETNEVYKLSEDYVSDEFKESYDAMFEIRRKIPYLLKKLQDGSKFYGVSLLSLFIARDGVIQNKNVQACNIKPQDILAFPIYSVSSNGELLNTFDPDTANGIEKFRIPKDLVLGTDPRNPYYRAGIELTSCVRLLGYNLYEEDVRDYSPSYINRLMCSYIMSNQEVLLDIGAHDPNIMNLFKNGTLFETPTKKEINVHSIDKILKLREMARQKVSIVPELHEICNNSNEFRKLSEPLKLIDQFFTLYKSVYKNTRIEEAGTYDCMTDNGVLCDASGQPLIFKMDAFVIGITETPLFNFTYMIITDKGYAVKVDNEVGCLTVTDIVSCLTFYETRNINTFISKKEVV